MASPLDCRHSCLLFLRVVVQQLILESSIRRELLKFSMGFSSNYGVFTGIDCFEHAWRSLPIGNYKRSAAQPNVESIYYVIYGMPATTL